MSDDYEIFPDDGIIHQEEGVDLLPANIDLSDIDGIVLTLVSERTNLAKPTEQTIKDYYGSMLRICGTGTRVSEL